MLRPHPCVPSNPLGGVQDPLEPQAKTHGRAATARLGVGGFDGASRIDGGWWLADFVTDTGAAIAESCDATCGIIADETESDGRVETNRCSRRNFSGRD